MTRTATSTRRTLRALALLAACAVARAASAGGGDEACTAARVVERGALAPAWLDAVLELRSAVARLGADACSASTVVVEPAPPGARVLVVAADGRQTERLVYTPGALRAVVMGVLATVPTERPAASARPQATAAASPPASSEPAANPEARGAPPPPAAAPTTPPGGASSPQGPHASAPAARSSGFALAPSVGVRYGAPTPVGIVDVSGRVEVRVNDWLVFASGRYAFVGQHVEGAPLPGWSYDEIAFGLGVGRRLHLGDVVVDVAVVPEVVVVTEEADVPRGGVEGMSNELRAQGVVRALAPVGGRLRPAILVDGEVAPLTLASPTRVDPSLPPLPTWTVGLGAGIVWDVP